VIDTISYNILNTIFNRKEAFKLSSESRKDLCSEFVRILEGSGSVIDGNGVFIVYKFRDIPFTIVGCRTNSTFVNPHFFSFENLDRQGNALNLGEATLLQEDVNQLLIELRKRNIIVTAVYNHWLFEEPPTMSMYFEMYFESNEPPLEFARKVRKAFRVLKK
jgi:hypothetical protein